MGDFHVTKDEREAMRHEAEENPHAPAGYRTDVPRLLDALEAAEAELARLREELASVEEMSAEVAAERDALLERLERGRR